MPLLTHTFDSFGLDIGDRSMKAVYCKQKGTDYTLESFGTINIPEGVFKNGEIIQPQELPKYIHQLLQKVQGKKISTKYAHVCLPETLAFVKLIALKADIDPKELPAHIRESLPLHIPIDPDDVYISWQILPTEAGNPIQVLVGAIPKKVSDMYIQVLLQAGITPLSLQIEAEAILRSLLPMQATYEEPIAIVDFGATRSSFICYHNNTIQFTVSMPVSSDELTRIIADKLQLTHEEADKAKHVCGLDSERCENALNDILEPSITLLIDAIKKNLNFYTDHFQNAAPITSIMLCGGGSNLIGFPELLNERIKDINIVRADPLVNVVRKRKQTHAEHNMKHGLNFLQQSAPEYQYHIPEQFTVSDATTYTTAIGLALSNGIE